MTFRSLFALVGLLATLTFVAAEANAAPRMNAGSRGNRTHTAPPPTPTSPNAARPIERSATPAPVARPGAAPAAQPGGFFSRPGLLGGLAAGFLGAGLIGLLMGNGLMGGLGGLASFFGLLLQVGLVALVAFLAWRWWQRRSQPAQAFATGPAMRDMNGTMGGTMGGTPAGQAGFFGGAGGPAPAADTPIQVTQADYEAFERTLREVQAAYSSENVSALRMRVTAEMLAYYSDELAANQRRGVVNRITDVKLLQGDLAEAWREGDTDYATVAMRYSQVDKFIDRNSGKVVEGSDTPDEGVEYWTFRRTAGGPWMVSAIQQTD
jgi:predicted lipid-binding transport protein (Tim44 family)